MILLGLYLISLLPIVETALDALYFHSKTDLDVLSIKYFRIIRI
jgi:hypothetical protein